MIHFSLLQTRPVLHEVLIAVFVTVTTPVTLMVLVRAALFRDYSESRPKILGEAKLDVSSGGNASLALDL
jgi:multicomponent K+:H+ antiporter subunit G